MKAILIYPQNQIQRNQFAINVFERELGAKLVTPSYNGSADFVINRTNDYTVARRFEQRGIRVFNPSTLSKIANDKQLCYDYMQSNNIPILPTHYSNVPFIKKPKNGHGGVGVVMCNNVDEYDENMVCQKPATDLGKDLRVWIIGGKIIASVLRVSTTDFRSNYCLGGNAEVYNLNNDEIAQIKKIIPLLNGDYYGIDFVFNNGKIIFNEVEDTVGARMVYDKTDIDILKLYCDYIKSEIGV